ncbi:hypothetical protein [Rhizobium indigoferae]|uniref:DNA-directed DNA polymerase family A palm domain-containing protein n=1 Tax=Rhizobium indigoferae TaxID=158891 RepID=A0ABZ0ZLK3_9HYPH|nr:hypothetical protein [Rhizobium indigoferae]NNU57597.1 hypothetical protein [Rhizobium indigoferae]WQN39523.1 hypothetical protein U5G49_004727 [Rhizobium indigoferae]GLR60800.1 hypothetical protein GCM10007919_55290 [Rhizobium indigoferae]
MTESASKDTSKPVDRPFSPWRFAKTEASKALITEAIGDIQRYEEQRKLRQRKRKEHDRETFELTAEAILCDLMHHALYRRPDAIYVTRSNAVLRDRNRYRPRVYGKTFPDVLDRLAAPELGWIVQEIGDSDWRQGARRTSIRPGPHLLARIDTGGITFADLGLARVTEPIILKSEKADFWDEAQVIDYLDTEETSLFRREMRDINEWLRSADIDYGTYRGDTGHVPDTGDRDLRRIFTRGRFDNGGRLFGGFWQGMSKESRFDRLVIDGEAIVELDYAQMGPRQLYGIACAVPDAADLYAIPGFEEHRKGIKIVFSAMAFHDKPLTRMPRGAAGKFPRGARISEITEAIMRHHPAIADLFFSGVGHQVQFQESRIMVDILLSLKSNGIVALPIHDAILVASSNAAVAKQVMADVFSHHVGFPGLVDVSSTHSG